MGWLAALGLVALGLLILAGGGEMLVRGAVELARTFGLSPALIGLTVVAMGTSIPELVVSLLASLGGQPDIAIGNVVGSNIMNVTFVLGISALVIALPIHGTAVKIEWPFMFVASCIFVLLARDGIIDRLEGGFFLIGLVLFMAYMVSMARTQVTASEARDLASEVATRGFGEKARSLAVPVAAVLTGIALLFVGGKALITGAVRVATLAGMSERVIGLTVVAAGTSMPEVATSLVAAYRRHTDVAVANVIGSNIFNILGILGVTGLVTPIRVSPEIVASDVWWMLGTSLLLLPLMRIKFNLSRFEGGVLLAAYGGYLAVLLRT